MEIVSQTDFILTLNWNLLELKKTCLHVKDPTVIISTKIPLSLYLKWYEIRILWIRGQGSSPLVI